MTQLYKIRRLEWAGIIHFERDFLSHGEISSKVAPFTITPNDETPKYRLHWNMGSYCEEWDEDYPSIKEAKQRANEYWIKHLEKGLIKCKSSS